MKSGRKLTNIKQNGANYCALRKTSFTVLKFRSAASEASSTQFLGKKIFNPKDQPTTNTHSLQFVNGPQFPDFCRKQSQKLQTQQGQNDKIQDINYRVTQESNLLIS